MNETHLDEPDYFEAPPMLARIVAETTRLGFDMASEPRTGALLRTLAAASANSTLRMNRLPPAARCWRRTWADSFRM